MRKGEVDHAGQELTVHLDFVAGCGSAPGAAHKLLYPVHDAVECGSTCPRHRSSLTVST